MNNSEPILWSSDKRGVATIILNRPRQHNAMNAKMICALNEAGRSIEESPDIRVVVLTGAGESFCAGADLNWMREQMGADRARRIAEAKMLTRMLATLNNLSKPTIARINGNAYGGGVGLFSVCDISIASGAARFALTETKLGLIPATIGPYVHARLGQARMRQIALNGAMIKGAEAAKIGLVSRVAPPDRLDHEVENQIIQFLQCAPGAVAETKSLIRELANSPGLDQSAMMISRLADRWETAEAAEGVRVFFDQTKPSWVEDGGN